MSEFESISSQRDIKQEKNKYEIRIPLLFSYYNKFVESQI